jgi:CTP synthase (UTP-ammonia lyase)
MVRTLEVYDFKGECPLAVVYLVIEHDRQSDHAEGHNPSSEDDPMERRMQGTQFACHDVHLFERTLVKDVYATSSVHKDFSHFYASNDRADHQRELTSLDDMIEVIERYNHLKK